MLKMLYILKLLVLILFDSSNIGILILLLSIGVNGNSSPYIGYEITCLFFTRNLRKNETRSAS